MPSEGQVRPIPVSVTTDKQTRMYTQSSQIESGYVLLPEHAPWLEDFRAEILQFPHGRYDDQVDSLSQYLERSRTAPVHEARIVLFESPFSVDWESEFGTSSYWRPSEAPASQAPGRRPTLKELDFPGKARMDGW